MRLPDLAPLASPDHPTNSGELLLWARGIASFLKRLTDRHNATVQALHQVADGHGHIRGEKTLRDGQTTTVVSAPGMLATSTVQLTAGTGTWTSTALRVSSRAKDTFTITHSNEAATDRVVFWVVLTAG